jgi:hypothetical protein
VEKERQPVPTVTVIICAYTDERWDDLIAAVESVQQQQPTEIIVVIDHNQRLLERASARFSTAIVVPNTMARGLSGARNCGLLFATGMVVAFLDDDAMVAPEWLPRLRAAYDDNRVLGVGGPVEPAWAGARPRWFPDEFDWVVGCTYRGLPEAPADVRALIGANMSMRREVFETVGAFHSGVGRVGARPVAGEETELCIRARQRWPERFWHYEPSVRVHHRVPKQRASFAYFRARAFAEGLSKARISRLVGMSDGTAAERAYTLQTLPRGIRRNLRGVLQHGDLFGFARAGAIVIGLAFTVTGYLVGSIADIFSMRHGQPEWLRIEYK